MGNSINGPFIVIYGLLDIDRKIIVYLNNLGYCS